MFLSLDLTQAEDISTPGRLRNNRRLGLQGPVRDGRQWLEAFVRISVERGSWSIAVRFEGMSRWIPAGSWRTYLDGVAPAEPDLDGQASFVRYRLSEAAGAIGAAPQAERELVRLSGG